jgi:hypothetical protein
MRSIKNQLPINWNGRHNSVTLCLSLHETRRSVRREQTGLSRGQSRGDNARDLKTAARLRGTWGLDFLENIFRAWKS